MTALSPTQTSAATPLRLPSTLPARAFGLAGPFTHVKTSRLDHAPGHIGLPAHVRARDLQTSRGH
jgi:hypothetical protein